MKTKKIIASLAALVCLSIIPCSAAFAEDQDTVAEDEIELHYEIADRIVSVIGITDGTATCLSEANGYAVSISVEHTIQKYWGLWIWNDVDDATWTKTVYSDYLRLSSTKSGLTTSGKYRLKSVFTLTDENGKTETITSYSDTEVVE